MSIPATAVTWRNATQLAVGDLWHYRGNWHLIVEPQSRQEGYVYGLCLSLGDPAGHLVRFLTANVNELGLALAAPYQWQPQIDDIAAGATQGRVLGALSLNHTGAHIWGTWGGGSGYAFSLDGRDVTDATNDHWERNVRFHTWRAELIHKDHPTAPIADLFHVTVAA